MAAYTTTRLLESIERQSFSPANQSTFSTADILALADEVTRIRLLKEVLSVREEFYVAYKDYTITASQSTYRFPARAIGMTLREIHVVSSDGTASNLPRWSIDKLHLISTSGEGVPEVFYIQGDDVILYPTPNSTTGTLRMYYRRRPSDLIETSSAAVVSAINTTTNVVSVTTIPSTWVTGNIFDLIQQDGSHKHLSIDLTSTLVSGNDITFSSLPSQLAVGDYVALAGYTPVVQLPPDFQPILSLLTAAEMISAMDQAKGDKLIARAELALNNARELINPRVEGELETIYPDWS